MLSSDIRHLPIIGKFFSKQRNGKTTTTTTTSTHFIFTIYFTNLNFLAVASPDDSGDVVGLLSIKDLVKEVVQNKDETIRKLSNFALGRTNSASF